MVDQSEQKEHSCHHVTFRPVTLKQLVHALNVGIRKTLTQSLNCLFPYNLLGIQLNYEYCLETGISAVLLVNNDRIFIYVSVLTTGLRSLAIIGQETIVTEELFVGRLRQKCS